jgi:hypothetical protein
MVSDLIRVPRIRKPRAPRPRECQVRHHPDLEHDDRRDHQVPPLAPAHRHREHEELGDPHDQHSSTTYRGDLGTLVPSVRFATTAASAR